jgi:glyoxylase-like metal-dependent hydrolase (beta-lactamase superfamily II)
MNGTGTWDEVAPGVLRFRDSCNVYALLGPDGAVIVDAGTGAWIDALDALPVRPVAVLLTHFFRDHGAGAARAARDLGVPILAPEREADLLRDPATHFRRTETWIRYTNYWDHFAPIEPIPISGVLRDDERLTLGGLELEVVPLPGATLNQVGIAFRLGADGVDGTGALAVCSAETIHSPGRIPRVAPLQYEYNDLKGAVEVWHSVARLRARHPSMLLPSLGEPVTADVDAALAATQASLEGLLANRPVERSSLRPGPAVRRIADRVWLAEQGGSISTFVVGRGGTALAIDYGYHSWRLFGLVPPVHKARSLLHALDELRAEAGVERIDVVIPSHYHDDHISSIPPLQRRFGTQVWAHEGFADILEDPASSAFPCTWPEAIPVARRLGDGRSFAWEDVEVRVAAATGHTRFEQLVAFEVDGVRYAHSGDQYGYLDRAASDAGRDVGPDAAELTDWSTVIGAPNHVYRGGAMLDSFRRSAAVLRAWDPAVVLSGHWPPFIVDDAFHALLDEHARHYEDSHLAALPLAENDVHFGVDAWGGFILPYRVHVPEGGTARVRATVRNPFGRRAELAVRLVGGPGWVGTGAVLAADAREEAATDLEITPPPGPWHRAPVAVELTVEGRPFGQVAEALVTVGGEAW